MKTFFGAALSALLLSAPMVASAATIQHPMRLAESGVAADPSPAPLSFAVRAAPWTSTLDYQDGIHLRPSVGLSTNPNIVPMDSTMALVNQTGGER
ncbi:MAG TPA: hypothetical protein VMA86_01980 [Acetobacteraceae bacterium]|nr:hypothetical protein [Acetobacteraceae bacterium]